jgi:hypothetical protein
MTEQQTDQTQPAGLDQAELEAESGEELPEREAMSIITPPGDSLGPPPISD